MKIRLLAVLVLTLLPCFALKGQSFVEQLALSEQIKEQYGETDDRYLDALTSAIQAASGEENNEEANRLRLIHIDIVAKKYGENSIEYAEDLWRLGNVSSYKGREYTFECYKRAKKIYEALDAMSEYPYCDIMLKLAFHYFMAGEFDMIISCLRTFCSLSEPWINREWKGFTPITGNTVTTMYISLGRLARDRMRDLVLSNEIYEECVGIIEKHELFEEAEMATAPYLGLYFNNYNLGNYEEAEGWHLRYLDVIDQSNSNQVDPYKGILSSIKFICSSEDAALVKKVSREILALIEQGDVEAGVSPKADTLYLNVHRGILLCFQGLEEWAEVIGYAPELLNYYEEIGMGDSYEYWETLGILISGFCGTDDYIKAYSVYNQFEELADKLDLKSTENYRSYLTDKVVALGHIKKKNEYEEATNELMHLTNSLYGENSRQALNVVLSSVVLTIKLFDLYDKREEVAQGIDQCYQILNKGENLFYGVADSLETMSILHFCEGEYYTSSNIRLAEEKYLMAINESDSLNLDILPELLINTGAFYSNIKRDFDTALNFYERARRILENAGDRTSDTYIYVLTNLALYYKHMGMNSVAIVIYDYASKVVGDNDRKEIYGLIEGGKADFYSGVGNYPFAIICCKNALECYKGLYGEESNKYIDCLQDLGRYYYLSGDFSAAKDALIQTTQFYEKRNSIKCIDGYLSLSNIYCSEEEYDKAEAMLERAGMQLQLIGSDWESTNEGANLYAYVGMGMFSQGNPEGKVFMERAINIANENEIKPARSRYLLSVAFWLMSLLDNSYSEEPILLILDEYKTQYLGDVVFLNENERESLLSGVGFSQTKNIMFSSRQTDKYDAKLYDFLLFNKGLLLETSIDYARAVYDSGDEELIKKYETLQNLRRYVNGEPVTLDNDYTTEKAKTEATVLEREITQVLRQNGSYVSGLDCMYEDVRNALSEDETAVEFVNYYDYTDSTEYYVALLAKKGLSKPEYVGLCKATDMDSLLTQSPDTLYCKDSTTAYRLLWSPLEPYLDSVKTVYFSPAGHLNRMAVECLYNGEQRFNEAYNVVRLTSTREICNKRSEQNYTSAVLYGGLTYEEDDDTMLAESRKVSEDVSGFRNRFRGFYDGVDRRKCEYLKHTLEEVNHISAIMGDAKIGSRIYSGEKGNEESFKALSGTEFNILHIATHGFYMTDTQAEKSDFFSSHFLTRPSFDILGEGVLGISSQSAFSPTEISPLQRSGLILSGGNRAWMGQPIPDGVEDGVLTAAEVANLDFSSCDIVVLSACETGLGEITDEGVFGLQRAFKNAGVNTIVMSLWEVDDAATSLMMQTFYQNLVSGMTKREAFLAAQEKVREQNPDPRYWAAFIMLD